MNSSEKYNLCCIGHITRDKIINPRGVYYLSGGTSFYFSNAVKIFDDIRYHLVTSLGEPEYSVIEDLKRHAFRISVLKSEHSVFFENIYGDDPDKRTQRVLAKASPFTVDYMEDVNADIIHIGALLADDFPPGTIEYLSDRGKISIDSQGFLRDLKENNVIAVNWKEKKEILKKIYFLKANEFEAKTLTGLENIFEAAMLIHKWGVKEVIITLGGYGSVIFNGREFHIIPAYGVKEAVDATGCGDTFMGGYLYKRAKQENIDAAGHFGAAMASLKIQHPGPFAHNLKDIYNCMENYPKIYPAVHI